MITYFINIYINNIHFNSCIFFVLLILSSFCNYFIKSSFIIMELIKESQSELNSIKPINVDTVHKICSGQVVLSLAVAVKELVENSLDAGATNIDVRLKNYGLDLIEVSDNGCGVLEHNFAALTLKYHTSKLSEYSDLLEVSSFGFRGEALSSLCSLADLTITTRHKNSDYATKIQYDHKGNIASKYPCSRQVGTTVTLSNLFKTLPVRQKEFQKNAKREFNRMTNLLYAYCLISLGVKITCSNQTTNNIKSLVVATQGSMSYKDNIASIFGVKQLQTILEIKTELASNIKDNIFKGLSGTVTESEESVHIEDTEIDLSEDSNDTENIDVKTTARNNDIANSQKSQGYKNVANPLNVQGFISSCAHGSGRSSSDRQYYYINSRPCEPTKIIKLVNDIYRQYNPNQYPFVFININLDRTSVDVNVTPDKRKVFLTKEKSIMDTVKLSLLKLFEHIPRTLKMEPSSNILSQMTEYKPDLDQPRIFNSFIKQFSKDNNDSGCDKSTIDTKDFMKQGELKRKSSTLLDFLKMKSKKVTNNEFYSNDTEKLHQDISRTNLDISKEIETETKIELNCNVHKQNEDLNENTNYLSSDEVNIISPNNSDQEIMYLEGGDLPNTQIRSINDILKHEKSNTIYCKTKNTPNKAVLATKKESKTKVVTDRNEIGQIKRRSVNLKTSLDHVKILADIYNKQKSKNAPETVKFRGVINPVFNQKCEEELSREISKDSFKQMKVIGQFNLGFIITRLEDDLFIIDQHATDEIYNFETLQKTTELTHQKLVIPQQLELTGVNEQILMDNLDVFRKNGFTFEINETALPTKRVKLLTIPMSKNWIFGKEDIEELLFMLRESQSEHCRPSRIRAMFASRACRKSVMIGTALGKADMKKLVDHMAEIDKPWNCPHGRPTIRHLVNLAMIHTSDN